MSGLFDFNQPSVRNNYETFTHADPRNYVPDFLSTSDVPSERELLLHDRASSDRSEDTLTTFDARNIRQMSLDTDQKVHASRRPATRDVQHESLVATSVLQSPHHNMFANYTTFNRVQSMVFEQTYLTNRNLVISSPTGSGKTALLELAMLRFFGENQRLDWRPGAFKAVYVSPLKALCQEQTENWRNRFKSVYPQLKVEELTGDSGQDNMQDIRFVDVICTTPEKWDSFTRRWKNNKKIMDSVGLVMIDEVHLLNEGRGACMEAFVSRIKMIAKAKQASRSKAAIANLRLIALSATVPNCGDVSNWLDAEAHVFGSEFRPVPLRIEIFSVNSFCSNPFLYEQGLNKHLTGILVEHSPDAPSLIFCSTKKGCEAAAKAIVQDGTYDLIRDDAQRENLRRAAASIEDPTLKGLLAAGVGVHCGRLGPKDRRIVETLYRNHQLLVLCATTTLSQGVNMPAHLVIIRGHQQYTGPGGYKPYSKSMLLQLMGRAGRPQYDNDGVCVIMVPRAEVEKYRAINESADTVESNLHTQIIMHINAEIALDSIQDPAMAIDWFKSTFLYQRLNKNPNHYQIPRPRSQDDLDNHVKSKVMSHIRTLEEENLLVYAEDGFSFHSTTLGLIASKYYLGLETIKIMEQMPQGPSQRDLMEAVCKCAGEFEATKIKMGEKMYLNALLKGKSCKGVTYTEKPRYTFPGNVSQEWHKMFLLLQAGLSNINPGTSQLQMDRDSIMKTVSKLARAFGEFLGKGDDYQGNKEAVLLLRMAEQRMWGDTDTCVQIPFVGRARNASLSEKGVRSLRDAEANMHLIEQVVSARNMPAVHRFFQSIPIIALAVSLQAPNSILVRVTQTRPDLRDSSGPKSWFTILVGDNAGRLLFQKRCIVTSVDYSASFVVQLESSTSFVVATVIGTVAGFDCSQTLYVASGVETSEEVVTTSSDARKNSPDTTVHTTDEAVSRSHTAPDQRESKVPASRHEYKASSSLEQLGMQPFDLESFRYDPQDTGSVGADSASIVSGSSKATSRLSSKRKNEDMKSKRWKEQQELESLNAKYANKSSGTPWLSKNLENKVRRITSHFSLPEESKSTQDHQRLPPSFPVQNSSQHPRSASSFHSGASSFLHDVAPHQVVQRGIERDSSYDHWADGTSVHSLYHEEPEQRGYNDAARPSMGLPQQPPQLFPMYPNGWANMPQHQARVPLRSMIPHQDPWMQGPYSVPRASPDEFSAPSHVNPKNTARSESSSLPATMSSSASSAPAPSSELAPSYSSLFMDLF